MLGQSDKNARYYKRKNSDVMDELIAQAGLSFDVANTSCLIPERVQYHHKITGTVLFPGYETVEPGKYVTLGGLGSRFNGNHFASSVRHDISDERWLMVVNIGMSAD